MFDSERDLLADDKDALYFICGPESFMTETRSALKERSSIPDSRIRLELFGTGGTACEGR